MSHPPEFAAPAWPPTDSPNGPAPHSAGFGYPAGIPLPPPPGRLPATSAYLPLPVTAPVPPAPPGRPKAPRAILLAGVGCLLVALALGTLTVIQYRDSHSAQ